MKGLIKDVLKEVLDTETQQSNLDRLLGEFKNSFPDEYKSKIDIIRKFVVDYIQDHNFTVKFLNSCSAGFSGVRTRDQIIICAPNTMGSLGDFLYTIFHEIRHEEQLSVLQQDNPLTDYDLNDFEKLYEKYWEMEMDADRFAKEMVAKIIIKLDIPLEVAKSKFRLSSYIENYPSMGKMVMSYLQHVVSGIKELKKSGAEFTDIQDHPMVKRYIDKLENFI